MRDKVGGGGSAIYALAPWAVRRGRLVQLALVGGGFALASVILATLNGTGAFSYGILFAIVTLGTCMALAWYVRRLRLRMRLIVGTEGIEYDAGMYQIVAAWEDIVALDHVIRGSDTGPALVLRGDRAVGGDWVLRFADMGEAVERLGSSAPSRREMVPLNGFVQGVLAGSPLCAELRRHIPDIVDAFLARHGGSPGP